MEQSGQGIDKREHPESSGLGRKKKITMAKKVRKNRLHTSDPRGGGQSKARRCAGRDGKLLWPAAGDGRGEYNQFRYEFRR